MQPYSSKIEQKMQRLFNRLSEKDRRQYAAVEVEKLGHGGAEYISKLLGIDPKTIRKGMEELMMLENDADVERIRKKGAVAKALLTPTPMCQNSCRLNIKLKRYQNDNALYSRI